MFESYTTRETFVALLSIALVINSLSAYFISKIPRETKDLLLRLLILFSPILIPFSLWQLSVFTSYWSSNLPYGLTLIDAIAHLSVLSYLLWVYFALVIWPAASALITVTAFTEFFRTKRVIPVSIWILLNRIRLQRRVIVSTLTVILLCIIFLDTRLFLYLQAEYPTIFTLPVVTILLIGVIIAIGISFIDIFHYGKTSIGSATWEVA